MHLTSLLLPMFLLASPADTPPAAAAAVAADVHPITKISSVMILVKDQEEALQWYTQKLGFEKKSDQTYAPGKRFVSVAPPGQADPEIVLAKAPPGGEALIGKETTWVFEAADCRKAYAALKARGVVFRSEPADMPWGTQALFEDLYGNRFTLISYH